MLYNKKEKRFATIAEYCNTSRNKNEYANVYKSDMIDA
jgi:hypothetical protein